MMLLIVHQDGGWRVLKTFPHASANSEFIGGPYATHAEAVEAVETIAWRIAQGWKP